MPLRTETSPSPALQPTPATPGTTPAAPPSPAPSASPTTGLDKANAAGTAPTAGGVLGAVNSLGQGASLVALLSSAPQLPAGGFALVPGRYPKTVGLPDVVAAVGKSPEGPAVVKKLVGAFEAKTGLKVDPALLNAALANPQRLLDILQLTPAQMSAGFDALNAAHAAKGATAATPRARHLPKSFDLANLDKVNVPRPKAELKELAPGLLQGDVVSSLPDAQARRNIVMAEVFDRLAGNAELPAAERFSVSYGGGKYTTLETFLGALEKDGHTLRANIRHRVANFASLMTKAPTGELLDVPAPLLIRTGFKDAQGQEAVVPAVHSELVIGIDPPQGKAGVGAEVKWYQGVSSTGFFPTGLFAEPAWLGDNVAASLKGVQVTRAAVLAGLFSDIVNVASQQQHLVASGYGVTGVCNDSVAIIQEIVSGKATGYPLLMRDQTLQGELKKRLSDARRNNDPEYRAIGKAIDQVPSDVAINPTSKSRALASIPWASGKEPFQMTALARTILGG